MTILPIGAGIAGAACALAYAGFAAMWPTSQIYGKTLAHGPEDKPLVALTYDDGPNDPHTFRLLELLEKENCKATFFVIGKFVRQRPEIARAILRGGHALGNHTYHHPNLAMVSPARMRRELDDCAKAIEDATGETAQLFRPPFGGRRPDTLRYARKMRMTPVMWSVSGADWNPIAAEAIAGRITPKLRSGSIVLLHDGGHLNMGMDRGATVKATEILIRECKARGLECASAVKMLAASTV